MGDEGQRATSAVRPLSVAARKRLATAITERDHDGVADALVSAVEGMLSPLLVAEFMVELDGSVDMRRLVVDPAWGANLAVPPDFSWVEPLLGLDSANGASVVGPSLLGASQMGAVIAFGDGRFGYLVIAGNYADTQEARKSLGGIAAEAGTGSQLMRRSNERAAEVAALRERQRLSHDLHDSLSQSLWSLSMLSEVADSMTDADNPLHAVIRQIAEISLTSQEEMRSLLINLRTAEPSRETVVSVLETLVAEFRSTNSMQVVASIADVDLEPATVMALRRIAEEALNNVTRHANASTVAVLFDTEPVLSLRIADDGDGFDIKPVNGHLGLRVMSERAAEIDFEFDLAPAPGYGTLVTASSDLSAVRPLPSRRPEPKVPSLRRAASLGLVAALLGCLAMGLFVASRSYEPAIAEAQIDLERLTVLQARVRVARASENEATVRLLEVVGRATADDVARVTEERLLVLDSARDDVTPLAAPDTISGQNSLLLLEALAGTGLSDRADQQLNLLYDEIDVMLRPSGRSRTETTTPIHSLRNLAALDQVQTFLMLDSVVARYVQDSELVETPAAMRRFFEDRADAIRAGRGFFGPDETRAFRNGVTPGEIAVIHESDAVIELSHIVYDALLWDDDQWLRERFGDGVPPPTGLDNFVERARAASIEGDNLVDTRFEALQGDTSANLDASRSRAHLFAVAAGLLAIGGLLALILSNFAAQQRRRALTARLSIDPVTGLGGRQLLDTRVVSMLADPALTHHVMITLDMDRFSFINEVHGVAFADRMLEVVGIGLAGVVGYTPHVSGTAVRIDDDEFVVSLHSNEPIPAEMTDASMNRIRSTLISAPDGTLVRCSFSYGFVTAEGSPELASLMAACNLKMYQDKARAEA